jgi:hypothetical protein
MSVRGTKYEGLACGWDWCKSAPLMPDHDCAVALRPATNFEATLQMLKDQDLV